MISLSEKSVIESFQQKIFRKNFFAYILLTLVTNLLFEVIENYGGEKIKILKNKNLRLNFQACIVTLARAFEYSISALRELLFKNKKIKAV